MVANAGYTDEDIASMQELADKRGINLVIFNSSDELVDYINNGADGNRSGDKITKFEVYSHGSPGKVMFAHDSGVDNETVKNFEFNEASINKVDSNAFSNCKSQFYSCRAGNDTEESSYRLAQHWANVTGGTVVAPVGYSYETGKTTYRRIHTKGRILNFERTIERILRGNKPYPALNRPELDVDTYWKTFYPES